MAPIEDLQSRDLAWISDFVMQQMVIMLRPMMEHLQQTDATVDYTQHTVQRLSMDVSEVRSDLERTNKYLAILRQGLGVQNEGRCVLQRGVEGATRAAKRLDEQMEGVLNVMRGMEGTVGRLTSDVRNAGTKHDELARQVTESTSVLDDIQAKVERASNDAHVLKDSLLSSEARLEVWQRELRELRRQQLGIGAKLEDKTGGCPPPPSSQGCRALGSAETSWPQKKSLNPIEVCAGGGKDGASFTSATGGSDRNVVGPDRLGGGGSQQSKRMSRASSASKGTSLLTQDHLDLGGAPPRSSSHAGIWNGVDNGGIDGDDGIIGGPDDGSSSSSRLPLLAAARQPGVGRPQEGGYSEGPRLRFSATMVKPPSRGSPS